MDRVCDHTIFLILLKKQEGDVQPRGGIGQAALVHEADKRSSLDEIAELIDWAPIERELDVIYSARRGEASWLPLAMFRAMLLAIWHDLSDVRLADALDDRASFRRFCGFARTEATPGNAHDGRNGEAALPDEPGDVYADSGYRGEVFGKAVCARGGTPRVIATHVWAPSEEEAHRRLAEWNGPVHHVRCRIEKIFGTWKRSYGFRRMRWRGIAKASSQACLTAIADNLKRTQNIMNQA